jgi:toxin CptA
MKSAPAIAFDVVPSRRVAAAAAAVALLALVAVVICGLPAWLRVVLAALVIVYAARGLRRFLMPPWTRVVRDASGWRLVDRDGSAVAATLAGHVRRGRLLVLDFRVHGQRRFHCVVTPDVIDADVFRRLWLVLARGPEVVTPLS